MKHGLWPLTAERMQISGEVSGSIVVSVRAHVLKRRLGCAKAVGRSASGSISYFVYFVYFVSPALCLVGEGHPLSWLHNASMRTWSSNGKAGK